MDIDKGASIAMKGKNVKILDKLTGKTISSKIMTKKSSNDKSYISAKEVIRVEQYDKMSVLHKKHKGKMIKSHFQQMVILAQGLD